MRHARPLLSWVLLLIAVGGVGLVHHAWQARLAAKKAAAGKTELTDLGRKIRRAQKDFDRLDPLQKELFMDSLPASHRKIATTLLVHKLLKLGRGKQAFKAYQDYAEWLRRLGVFLRRAGVVLAVLLWLLAAGAWVWVWTGFYRNKKDWLGRVAHVATLGARIWIGTLALSATTFFALTMKNPWPLMPRSFYFAPLLLLAAGLSAKVMETGELEFPDSLPSALTPLAAAVIVTPLLERLFLLLLPPA